MTFPMTRPSGCPFDPASEYAALRRTFRHVTEDIPVGARALPAGDYLVAALSSANRDEQAFPDPDSLDLTRPAAGHVAFGFGPHQCLGPFEEIRFKDNTLVYGVTALPVNWE